MIENVGISRKSPRTAHDGNALPLAIGGIAGGRNRRGIQLQVVANEKIEVTVPVIIEKGTPRAPANLCLVEAGFMGDVGKRAVSVVAKKNVVSPEAAEQIIPSVVVVIAYANPRLPTGTRQARFLADIGESAVAVVFVQMRDRCFSRRPMRIELIAIGEVDVEPAVVVKIKKGKPAPLSLDDGPLVVHAAPHVGAGETCLLGHIHILDRRRCRSRDRGLKETWFSPPP